MIGTGTAVCMVALAIIVAICTLAATALVVQGFKPRPRHRRTATVPAHLVPVGRWTR